MTTTVYQCAVQSVQYSCVMPAVPPETHRAQGFAADISHPLAGRSRVWESLELSPCWWHVIVIGDGTSSPSTRNLCEKAIGSTWVCMKYREGILLLYKGNQKVRAKESWCCLFALYSVLSYQCIRRHIVIAKPHILGFFLPRIPVSFNMLKSLYHLQIFWACFLWRRSACRTLALHVSGVERCEGIKRRYQAKVTESDKVRQKNWFGKLDSSLASGIVIC